jgi:hypothetical protein
MIERKDGVVIPVSLTISVLRDKHGKYDGHICILRDITEHKKAEERIRKATEKLMVSHEELKRSDKMKTDFMNVVAHELRTPLTPMRGYIEMLSKEQFGSINTDQKKVLNMIITSVDKATKIISDILSLSRLEERKVEFTLRKVNLNNIIVDIVSECRRDLDYMQHKLTLNVPRNLEPMIGDKILLKSVILNLLMNAINYTPQHGSISIRAYKEAGNIHIEVSDNGIGIPAEQQDKIFDKFYQISNRDKKVVKGVGIGLYLTKSIVDMHDGKIWVESRVGKGSTFHVLLPVKQK